jgi:ferredoxin-nitrite reductase
MSWLSEPIVCPGLFYGTPAEDGALLRLRVPGGQLDWRQCDAIATLSRALSPEADPQLQVTNRANLQLRGVAAGPTVAQFQVLQGVGLAGQDPRLDHLRNLMMSPTAGIDPEEWLDPWPLVQGLDRYIQTHPSLAGLPAKFSIGLDGGGSVGIGVRSQVAWQQRPNEIQLTAVSQQAWRLQLLSAVGLMDTGVLIPAGWVLDAIAALTAIYRDYGQQHTPPGGKPPRLRQVLADWGLGEYLTRVKQRAIPALAPWFEARDFDELELAAGDPISSAALLPPTQAHGGLGIQTQKQPGLVYVGLSLPLGHLPVSTLTALADLAVDFGSGQLRLTPWPGILLPDVPEARVTALSQRLQALGLAVAAPPSAGVVACTGKPGCKSADTQTQPHALAVMQRLDQQQARLGLTEPVNVHVTGCPKSCAQSGRAAIAVLGVPPASPDPPTADSATADSATDDSATDDSATDADPPERFDVYLGDHRQVPPAFTQVPAPQLPDLIEWILTESPPPIPPSIRPPQPPAQPPSRPEA